MSDAAALINRLTREVNDFPSPGVQFKDLTPVLADPQGLVVLTDALAESAEGADLIAGVDARGFLLGAAVALRRGTGVLAVRKGGKPVKGAAAGTGTLGDAVVELAACWALVLIASGLYLWWPRGRWKAAGLLYPLWGVLMSPVFASFAMAFSSVSVLANALRLRRFAARQDITATAPGTPATAFGRIG